jgi:histidine ammonia-lyase
VIGVEKELGQGTRDVYKKIRDRVPFVENDCYMKAHMDEVAGVVSTWLK